MVTATGLPLSMKQYGKPVTPKLRKTPHDIYHLFVGLAQPHYTVGCQLDSHSQLAERLQVAITTIIRNRFIASGIHLPAADGSKAHYNITTVWDILSAVFYNHGWLITTGLHVLTCRPKCLMNLHTIMYFSYFWLQRFLHVLHKPGQSAICNVRKVFMPHIVIFILALHQVYTCLDELYSRYKPITDTLQTSI